MFGKKHSYMRFSESVLWEYQRDFFSSQGVNAWIGQVPFFITSNPNIGISYARVILAYIKDKVAQGLHNPELPFYILELGTGPGKFSFYCLKKLTELLDFEFNGKVKICYIMSDFTKSNVEFWNQHPQLNKFVEAGTLDFACVDMTNIEAITLENSNKQLSKSDFENGLVVIGNYIFDTVPHDAFSVQNGKLFEARCAVEVPKSNLVNNKPKDLEKIKVTFCKSVVKRLYPEYNEQLKQVLDEYTKSLKSTTFLIPISGIKTLDHLAEISGENMLVISTDKGATSLEELDNMGDPHVVFHGSFSMTVNFNAMARYNELKGGDAMLQPCHHGIKTVVMSRGFKFDTCKHLKLETQENICDKSPSQFFHMHRHFRKDPIDYGLDTCIAYLVSSHWDPYVFSLIQNNLLKKLGELNPAHLEVLDQGMLKLEENIFYMPNHEDHWQLIGTYFQFRGKYETAIEFSNKSIKFKGENYSALVNIGFAHNGLKQYEQAISAFEKALNHTNDPKPIEKLIQTAKSKL